MNTLVNKIVIIGCFITSINLSSSAHAEEIDYREFYISCAEDVVKLNRYITEEFMRFNTEESLNFAGLKKSTKELKKYAKRFSLQECGNTYNYIGLDKEIGLNNEKEQLEFFGIGLRIESIIHFVKIILNSYQDFENSDLVEVKERLKLLTIKLLDLTSIQS